MYGETWSSSLFEHYRFIKLWVMTTHNKPHQVVIIKIQAKIFDLVVVKNKFVNVVSNTTYTIINNGMQSGQKFIVLILGELLILNVDGIQEILRILNLWNAITNKVLYVTRWTLRWTVTKVSFYKRIIFYYFLKM